MECKEVYEIDNGNGSDFGVDLGIEWEGNYNEYDMKEDISIDNNIE